MDFLEKLDNYYYSKKASEVWLMTLLMAVLIGYALYTIISTSANDFRITQEKINSDLKNKISSYQKYLRGITINGDRNFYIKDLNKKIVSKKAKLNELRVKLNKLQYSLKDLKALMYTKDNWSKFLYNITKKAEENNINIYSIFNKNYEQNSTFAKVLDVNIKSKGEYGDILSFINSLEKMKLVTNITGVSVNSDVNNPIADINISVWSIRP